MIAVEELRVPRQRKLTDIGWRIRENYKNRNPWDIPLPRALERIREEYVPPPPPSSTLYPPPSFLSGIHSASIDAGY